MSVPYSIPILYYHSIAENCMSVTPRAFRAQMLHLRRRSYRVVTVGEAITSFAAGEPTSKTVALSFDDGFANVCANALPVLEEFGFRATCFVVPDYAGGTLWGNPVTGTWSVQEKPGLLRFPMMNWKQIAQWGEANMEVGSHTLSHRNLTDLPDAEARREISESKEFLEHKLGVPLRGFCYPRGRFADHLAHFVEQAGYHYACTTRPCRVTPESEAFLLPRIPGPSSVADLVFLLNEIPRNLLTRSLLWLGRRFERARL